MLGVGEWMEGNLKKVEIRCMHDDVTIIYRMAEIENNNIYIFARCLFFNYTNNLYQKYNK
jgi:hypothetical protein